MNFENNGNEQNYSVNNNMNTQSYSSSNAGYEQNYSMNNLSNNNGKKFNFKFFAIGTVVVATVVGAVLLIFNKEYGGILKKGNKETSNYNLSYNMDDIIWHHHDDAK